ncbi:MAG TPA: TetR/AcrR family transcriptional regulator [Spirochaetota bacterium]|nr:TetR/AcrR family transcriptional regulator [Spirochaetota bacterium]HPJ35278.1 TetR/AcrR family transcriptional regulator [Spirochaetota bacterium]
MKNPEETRNYIIEAAAPVFNKNGYVGASLSDILEQTNLTKGAIYHHFKNKDDLALAALEYNLGLISTRIFNKIKDKYNSCDKLLVFAESFRNNYDLMKQAGGCPVINAAVDSDDVNEAIRNRVCRFIRMWRKSLKMIIEQGKTDSEIRKDVDAEAFSMNFISLIEGSLAMSKVSDDRKFLDNAVDLVKFLVEQIRI